MDTSSHRADKLTKVSAMSFISLSGWEACVWFENWMILLLLYYKLSSYTLLSSDKFASLCKLVKTLSDHVIWSEWRLPVSLFLSLPFYIPSDCVLLIFIFCKYIKNFYQQLGSPYSGLGSHCYSPSGPWAGWQFQFQFQV